MITHNRTFYISTSTKRALRISFRFSAFCESPESKRVEYVTYALVADGMFTSQCVVNLNLLPPSLYNPLWAAMDAVSVLIFGERARSSKADDSGGDDGTSFSRESSDDPPIEDKMRDG